MAAASKRWRLVCYDIREPARWRKVYKIVCGAGQPVQYSVFRCRLDDREVEKLRWELSKVMGPEDALLVVDLCPTCSRNVISRNHVEGWAEVAPTFRIVGAVQQALADGDADPVVATSQPVASAGNDRSVETE